MKLPWDYSKPPAPGAPATINLPTPEGRMLGQQLARFATIEERKQLQQFPDMPTRCHDCAFRRGTRPNGCPETVMDALKCAIEGEPFYCHLGVKDGEAPRRLCQGWLVWIAANEPEQQRPPILLGPIEKESNNPAGQ